MKHHVTEILTTKIPGVLRLDIPENYTCALIDSPHSGTDYPTKEKFGYACKKSELRQVEDTHVDALFEGCLKNGITLLRAMFPRNYVDLNRPPNALTRSNIRGPWTNTNLLPNEDRIARAGMGTIPFKTGDRLETYIYQKDQEPDQKEILYRLDKFWRPYHDALQNTAQGLHEEYGAYFHLNAHSMPTSSSGFQFVVGNRNGTTASSEYTQFLLNFFKNHPSARKNRWSVGLNVPYAGKEIVKTMGQPHTNKDSAQLEIDRSLYMDERTRKKHGGFDELQALLQDFSYALSTFAQERALTLKAEKDRAANPVNNPNDLTAEL